MTRHPAPTPPDPIPPGGEAPGDQAGAAAPATNRAARRARARAGSDRDDPATRGGVRGGPVAARGQQGRRVNPVRRAG